MTTGITGSNTSNLFSAISNHVQTRSYSFKGNVEDSDTDGTFEEEDAVTCSMHSVVAPYMIRLRQKGKYKVGDRIRCFQASPRGGYMTCIIIGKKS